MEVYDKDTDQDDFLGRYIYIVMSLVCLRSISHCHLSFVIFPCQLEQVHYLFIKHVSVFLLHLLSMLYSYCFQRYIFFFLYLILPCTPFPFRTKLDLCIVKKSIVVDDVSKSYYHLSHSLNKLFLSHCVNVCLWLSSQWFTLTDTPSGRVHFRLEWLALLPATDRLEQV